MSSNGSTTRDFSGVVVAPAGAVRAATNPAAEANRSAGALASARSTAAFTGSASPARVTRGGGGACESNLAMTAGGVGPGWGGAPGPQRLALDVGHDVVEDRGRCRPTGPSAVEQRQDMGMAELGGDPDLVQEPLGAEHRGQLGAQDLQRNGAI